MHSVLTSWRMRQIINKLIREEDLYSAVESAYSQGWQRVKLYFLIGLPSETDEDTLGIAELAKNCVAIGRKHNKRASVTVSIGGFVPKPFTPFQWFGQNTSAELQRKVNLLRDATRKMHGVNIKWHDPKCGRTGETPSLKWVFPTVGGLPATTAGPVPATASSMSWPPQRHLRVAARGPGKISRLATPFR